MVYVNRTKIGTPVTSVRHVFAPVFTWFSLISLVSWVQGTGKSLPGHKTGLINAEVVCVCGREPGACLALWKLYNRYALDFSKLT